jgi:hypothetical protein
MPFVIAADGEVKKGDIDGFFTSQGITLPLALKAQLADPKGKGKAVAKGGTGAGVSAASSSSTGTAHSSRPAARSLPTPPSSDPAKSVPSDPLFPLFQALPADVKSRIWEFALAFRPRVDHNLIIASTHQTPRRLYDAKTGRTFTTKEWHTSLTYPAAMQSFQALFSLSPESRAVFAASQTALGRHAIDDLEEDGTYVLKEKAWLDPERDLLYITDKGLMTEYGTQGQILMPMTNHLPLLAPDAVRASLLLTVRRLALDVLLLPQRLADAAAIRSLLGRFEALEEVVLVQRSRGYSRKLRLGDGWVLFSEQVPGSVRGAYTQAEAARGNVGRELLKEVAGEREWDVRVRTCGLWVDGEWY